MRRSELLSRTAGLVVPGAIAFGVLGSGGANAQPDFTPAASFGTSIPNPFYPDEYYAADLDTADFVGATVVAIDGFRDVGVYSGPLGTGPSGVFPEEEFSSVITLFRNTQNWGTGGVAPTSGLTPYLTQPVVEVCVDCFAGEMQFAHMNNDTDIDIVATSTTLTGDGQVHVLIWNSITNEFNPPITFTGGGTSLPPVQAFGVGDFDGDGFNDIVASVHREDFPSGSGDAFDLDTVFRLKNINSGGSYGHLQRITPDISVTGTSGVADKPSGDIVVGEFNTLQGFPGSVRPDFITAEEYATTLSVGSGSGSFGFGVQNQPASFPCGNVSSLGGLAFNSMAAGNINAGSTLDLVATGSSTPTAYALSGDGRGRLFPICDSGVFVSSTNMAIPPSCVPGGFAPTENIGDYFLTLGYINDDAYSDIVLASAGSPTAERYIAIATGDGDGTFTIGPDCGHWLIYANSQANSPKDRVVTANMDNSGSDEILVLASWENSLVVYKNND